MKVLDEAGVARLVEKVGEAVRDGKWLPVSWGRDNNNELIKGAVMIGINPYVRKPGIYSWAHGNRSSAEGDYSHAEGYETVTKSNYSHAGGCQTIARGIYSHSEGKETIAEGVSSHTEGFGTTAKGKYSHAEGCFNYGNEHFIHSCGAGSRKTGNLNAEVIYIGQDEDGDPTGTSDPKNGYKYLLGIGGYAGQEIGDAKSLQEVIAEHEASLNDIGALSNEEIDSIIGDVA